MSKQKSSALAKKSPAAPYSASAAAVAGIVLGLDSIEKKVGTERIPLRDKLIFFNAATVAIGPCIARCAPILGTNGRVRVARKLVTMLDKCSANVGHADLYKYDHVVHAVKALLEAGGGGQLIEQVPGFRRFRNMTKKLDIAPDQALEHAIHSGAG